MTRKPEASPGGPSLTLSWTRTLAMFACTMMAGCNSPVRHPWQMHGDDTLVALDISAWPVVPQDLYVAVPEEKIVEAQTLLGEREHVNLADGQELIFNQHLERPADPALKPYLIRGVTMDTPWYTIIKRNPETNEISVHRASYDGEMTIPFVKPRFGIWPVVIYLEKPPLRVYPTAVMGGDWIFRGRQNADARLLNRNSGR